MTHRLFGTNNNARKSVHLVHPSKFASLQPEKLAVHKILAFLGKKICCFVHDFHPDWIARLNLPLSDGLHNQLQPHQVDRILRRLVFPYHDTARLEKNRTKMLQIFIGLEIGQRDYLGKQIVYCKPFRDKENDAGRMDCVFFIPPPPYYTGSRRDFDLSLENAWYGRVSLLCSMKFRTDSDEVVFNGRNSASSCCLQSEQIDTQKGAQRLYRTGVRHLCRLRRQMGKVAFFAGTGSLGIQGALAPAAEDH